MNCNNCGTEIKDNQKFCPKCGRKIDVSIDGNLSVTNIEPNSNKKKIIIAVIVVILVILITIFAVISNSPKYEGTLYDINKKDTEITILETTQSTKTTTTEELVLSDSCDKVLASGYDKENNFYELVANETEDYTGVDIKMGIIKNNEWLVNLSQDIPFINDEGALTLYNSSIYDKKYSKFTYIGNGCFYYNNCIINSNKRTSFEKEYAEGSWYSFIIGYDNDGYVMYRDIYKDNVFVINTNTMEKELIPGEWGQNDSRVLPCSDGLFAYINEYSTASYDGFYNFKGEKIIDLSQYRIENKMQLSFKNGECTFDVENPAGNDYTITINTKGDVINQVVK